MADTTTTKSMALMKKTRLACANVQSSAKLDIQAGCYRVPIDVMDKLFAVAHPETKNCPYCGSEPQTTGHSYNCKCSNRECIMFSHWMPIEFWNHGATSAGPFEQRDTEQ